MKKLILAITIGLILLVCIACGEQRSRTYFMRLDNGEELTIQRVLCDFQVNETITKQREPLRVPFVVVCYKANGISSDAEYYSAYEFREITK